MKLKRPAPFNVKWQVALWRDVRQDMNNPKWLTLKVYQTITEAMINDIKERLFSGEIVELGQVLGAFEIRKYKRKLRIKDGKLIGAPSDINWIDTWKWWREDPEARKRGDKLYYEQPWKFRMMYVKDGRLTFKNKIYTGFKFGRRVREDFVRRVKEGKVDAVIGG